MDRKVIIQRVYNKKVIEFVLWNIRHLLIWRRRTRKLVRPSPYELVPNISHYKFNNLWILHGVKENSFIMHGVKEASSARTTFARRSVGRKHLAAIYSAVSNQRMVKLESWQTLSNVNAFKIIRNNLPSILCGIKNIAVPNSRDIQQFSCNHRRANGGGTRRRQCLVNNVTLVTLTSFSISRQEAWLRVCMNTLLCRWKYWVGVNCGHLNGLLDLDVLISSVSNNKTNILGVYNKRLIEFILWNIRHSFICSSPYEIMPNISQY